MLSSLDEGMGEGEWVVELLLTLVEEGEAVVRLPDGPLS